MDKWWIFFCRMGICPLFVQCFNCGVKACLSNWLLGSPFKMSTSFFWSWGQWTLAVWSHPLKIVLSELKRYWNQTNKCMVSTNNMLEKSSSNATGDQNFLELKRLRLSWCHVKTFPMTLWQAKDELGFLRIQQFAYAVFFTKKNSLPINSNTNEESILALKMMINALSVMVHGLMSPRDT